MSSSNSTSNGVVALRFFQAKYVVISANEMCVKVGLHKLETGKFVVLQTVNVCAHCVHSRAVFLLKVLIQKTLAEAHQMVLKQLCCAHIFALFSSLWWDYLGLGNMKKKSYTITPQKVLSSSAFLFSLRNCAWKNESIRRETQLKKEATALGAIKGASKRELVPGGIMLSRIWCLHEILSIHCWHQKDIFQKEGTMNSFLQKEWELFHVLPKLTQ